MTRKTFGLACVISAIAWGGWLSVMLLAGFAAWRGNARIDAKRDGGIT